MSNKRNNKSVRMVAFMLVIVMLLYVCPTGNRAIKKVVAQETASATGILETDTLSPSEEGSTSGSETSTAEVVETSETTQSTTQMAATSTTEIATSTEVTTEVTTEEIPTLDVAYKERRAVWFSFFDLDYSKKTEAYFTKQIQKSFDNVKKLEMNTVVCHVRPFGDAMYPSNYFPWSQIASGKQGKDPGFDPLAIMVREAHKRDLRFEAWINPYRVSLQASSIRKLSKNNPARKWYSKKATKRNVLYYNGQYYYNPSKAAVRNLITNGIREIVENYPVDAIHFDDYFYPSFNTWNYKTAFDGPEYKAYVKKQKKAHKKVKSIQSYRRSQVNKLIKQVYAAVKDIDPKVEFGISPAGNMDNLKSKYSYYVDIDRWVSQPGYVDYVCPQIYWGFQNRYAPYEKVLNRWLDTCEGSDVKLYIGLGMYRCSNPDTSEWRNNKNIMKRQVAMARKKEADGFYFFTYSSFTDKRGNKEKKNLVKELKKVKN